MIHWQKVVPFQLSVVVVVGVGVVVAMIRTRRVDLLPPLGPLAATIWLDEENGDPLQVSERGRKGGKRVTTRVLKERVRESIYVCLCVYERGSERDNIHCTYLPSLDVILPCYIHYQHLHHFVPSRVFITIAIIYPPTPSIHPTHPPTHPPTPSSPTPPLSTLPLLFFIGDFFPPTLEKLVTGGGGGAGGGSGSGHQTAVVENRGVKIARQIRTISRIQEIIEADPGPGDSPFLPSSSLSLSPPPPSPFPLPTLPLLF